MPHPRTPQEKKRLSLAKDRRNTYGENDKASRKAIPRGKQVGKQRLRKAVHSALDWAKGSVQESAADFADHRVRSIQSTAKRRLLFRKRRDIALGEVLERKRRRQHSDD